MTPCNKALYHSLCSYLNQHWITLGLISFDRYCAVKKTCLVELGIPSQFVMTKTIAGRNQIPIVQKIAIQVNAKLGGANWGISSPLVSRFISLLFESLGHKKLLFFMWQSNAMVVGIDVYHNAGFDKSWSGFVASLNGTFTSWFSDSRQHQYENEIMNNISDIFGRALKAYYQVWIYETGANVLTSMNTNVFYLCRKTTNTLIRSLFIGMEWEILDLRWPKPLNWNKWDPHLKSLFLRKISKSHLS